MHNVFRIRPLGPLLTREAPVDRALASPVQAMSRDAFVQLHTDLHLVEYASPYLLLHLQRYRARSRRADEFEFPAAR